ncbi:MAG: prolipoprotein diacylglyceryl transferase [Vampirovibrionales bacterium]|nr:prolipoprotein diacylglyceryl transferase [Vampirovibrionales bacterium]
MHPILFEIAGFPIYSFGLLVGAAFIAATALAAYRANRMGQSPEGMVEAACWIIASGILGARLCYFIFFPALFLEDPLGSLLSRGGLVWYGGMISVLATMGIIAKRKRIPFLLFLDIWAMPAALGLAIGRLGCLMAGCCFGAPCDLPWAVQYPAGHETFPTHVHPSPLYETLSLLVLMGLMNWHEKKEGHRVGHSSVWFLVGYGVIRFVGEYFRGDRLVWLQAVNLSASQVISLAGIVCGLLLLWIVSWGKTHPVNASKATSSSL